MMSAIKASSNFGNLLFPPKEKTNKQSQQNYFPVL
jgi:hypothetical protein